MHCKLFPSTKKLLIFVVIRFALIVTSVFWKFSKYFVFFSKNSVQSELVEIQPTFKKDLLDRVETFKTESGSFYGDYDEVCKAIKIYFLYLLFSI